MPGCIVSATTASFRSVEKRRLRATPVITSTFENVSDIGVSLGLYLGPPAIVRVRSKRGAVQSDQLAAADHLIDTMNQCGCHVLKIAESGYHEERLFAQLAIGLTNQVSQGYGRLSSVFARWAYRPN